MTTETTTTRTIVKPYASYVLVTRQSKEEKTHGGIVIPETSQKKSIYAKVTAVGPGLWLDPKDGTPPRRLKPTVEVGDVVMLAEWSGNEIRLDCEGGQIGEDQLFIRNGDILAVVTE